MRKLTEKHKEFQVAQQVEVDIGEISTTIDPVSFELDQLTPSEEDDADKLTVLGGPDTPDYDAARERIAARATEAAKANAAAAEVVARAIQSAADSGLDDLHDLNALVPYSGLLTEVGQSSIGRRLATSDESSNALPLLGIASLPLLALLYFVLTRLRKASAPQKDPCPSKELDADYDRMHAML